MKSENNFFLFFVKEAGFWFLDCSSWDKKEILTAFVEDVSANVNKRIVEVPSDDEIFIKRARQYLHSRNTKNFVNLVEEFSS